LGVLDIAELQENIAETTERPSVARIQSDRPSEDIPGLLEMAGLEEDLS
jgi:hypothetical protein